MPIQQFSPCLLHVPYKDWSDDPKEKQNYEAIEQWSYRLPNCYEAAGPDPSGGGGALGPVSRAVGDSGGYSLTDNNSFYINWLTSLDASNSFGSAFTGAGTSLHVTGKGLITWSGDLRVLSPALPAVGSYARVTVSDSNQILQDNKVALLCKNFGTGSNVLDQNVAIGGAQYSELATNVIQIRLGVVTGGSATSFTVPFQVAICYFPWDGGP